MIESITFVVPAYRTAETLPVLIDAIEEVAPVFSDRHDVVVVDDACPQRSGMTVAGRRGVQVFGFDSNRGQRTAVLAGLSMARSEAACVMDADLQDDPASVVDLIAALVDTDADVVCAGRRGGHESRRRRVQAWAFRRMRWAVGRGVIPPDAGLFHVARAEAVRAMIELARPGDDPIVMYARSGANIISLPMQRRRRPTGNSSYDTVARLRMASASLTGLLRPLHPTGSLPEPRLIDPLELR